MALIAIGQPLPVVETGLTITSMLGVTKNSKITYADTIKPMPQTQEISLKQIAYLHGEPKVVWEEEEINQMIINEDLQYAVIENFSYR